MLAKFRKPVTLQVRRTALFKDAVIDPNYWVAPAARKNVYFEEWQPITVPASGSFTLALGLNQIWTLSTVTDMSRGDGSPGPDLGLPPIPNATQFPASRSCSSLTGLPVDGEHSNAYHAACWFQDCAQILACPGFHRLPNELL
eukprot:SAG22_NODE_3493_length_1683_cov_1.063131_1_plen_143_part_00